MRFSRLALALALCSGAARAQLPHAQSAAPATAELPNTGKVLTVIDVPTYTYIEVQMDKKTVWLAATTVKVKKGDTIRFDQGMEMNDFTSKALNRTFKSILFVGKVVVTGGRA